MASWCISRTRCIFSHIYEIKQTWKFKTLAFWQYWNISNSDTYSKPQRFRMKYFVKMFKSYNYFLKWFILDLGQGSEYVDLSISTQKLAEWPCAMYGMRHIKNPVFHRKFRHIKAYLRPARTYSALLWDTKTLDLSRIVSRHRLAYSEWIVILAYWEPCYIQNFGIFSTRGIFIILFI